MSSRLRRSRSLSGTSGLFQPRVSPEPAVLLYGTEDVLCDGRPRNGDATGAVREHVQPLSLAVAGIGVHSRTTQARCRDAGSLEPETFDFPLPSEMVDEDVAGDPNLVRLTPRHS